MERTAIQRLDAVVLELLACGDGFALETDGKLPEFLRPEWRAYKRALRALLRETSLRGWNEGFALRGLVNCPHGIQPEPERAP